MDYSPDFISLLKDPLIRSAIQDKNFRYIYESISGYKGVFTQFCYKVLKVDPLEYMNFIPNNFLDGCETIKEFIIPSRVTSIGNDAFYNCYNLTSIVIPNNVISIGERAFKYCDSLTSVEIGDSLTSIGHSAFADCYSLESVVIPNSVTSIDDYAFEECGSLQSIKYNGTIIQWDNIDKGVVWRYKSNLNKIICTDGEIDL